MKYSYIYTIWDADVAPKEAPEKEGELCKTDLADFMVNGEHLCEKHATAQKRAITNFKPAA